MLLVAPFVGSPVLESTSMVSKEPQASVPEAVQADPVDIRTQESWKRKVHTLRQFQSEDAKVCSSNKPSASHCKHFLNMFLNTV